MIFRRHSIDERPGSDIDEREDPYNVTQASRIYLLPNMMTAANLFCGFMAAVNCIQARLAESALSGEYLGVTAPDHYRYAVYFIFGAAFFDLLDGRLARVGGRESLFGAEFDSLADVISFGMAPALLMFFLILSPSQGVVWFRNIGWFVGFIYLLCAAMRLARFNVITNPYLRKGKKELEQGFHRAAGAGCGRDRGGACAVPPETGRNRQVAQQLCPGFAVPDAAYRRADDELGEVSQRQEAGPSDSDAPAQLCHPPGRLPRGA